MLLRQRVVNPDKLDMLGRTPLLYAAQSGHGRVVKLLLRQDDVNSLNCELVKGRIIQGLGFYFTLQNRS